VTKNKQATAQVEVGRLLCGQIRDYLAAERFRGARIEWIEGSGFVSRVFTIMGDAAAVVAIYKRLGALSNDT
jgi:hypothetical protein